MKPVAPRRLDVFARLTQYSLADWVEVEIRVTPSSAAGEALRLLQERHPGAGVPTQHVWSAVGGTSFMMRYPVERRDAIVAEVMRKLGYYAEYLGPWEQLNPIRKVGPNAGA